MQSLCISKSDFPCAQEARFSGNGRLFVDKNRLLIYCWVDDSSPSKSTYQENANLFFSDLTLECRTKTNHLINKHQQVLRRFHPSLVWEAWGNTRVPSCFLQSRHSKNLLCMGMTIGPNLKRTLLTYHWRFDFMGIVAHLGNITLWLGHTSN